MQWITVPAWVVLYDGVLFGAIALVLAVAWARRRRAP